MANKVQVNGDVLEVLGARFFRPTHAVGFPEPVRQAVEATTLLIGGSKGEGELMLITCDVLRSRGG